MTDEVAALVLRDNYFQTQALSIGRYLAAGQIDEQARFMRFLEKNGRLDRAIEFLPTDDELAERKARGAGLTTPEQAVLLAYSKMWLSDELVSSDLPEDPSVGAPATLLPGRHERAHSAITSRAIRCAAKSSPRMCSTAWSTGSARRSCTSCGTDRCCRAQVVRAYLLAREVFTSVELWQRIEALDNRVPDSVQCELLVDWRRLIARATTWFLRSRRLQEPLERGAQRLLPAVAFLRTRLEPEAAASAQAAAWVRAGVPRELAQQVGAADRLFSALDIAEIAEAAHAPLDATSEVHFGVGERLGLERLRQQIELLPADTHWQSLAKVALADDLADLHRSIALDAVSHTGPAPDKLSSWEARNPAAFARAKRLVAELADTANPDLAMLSVALRELRNLV